MHRETYRATRAPCHPEPAQRSEGSHNCNPRGRQEKITIATARSLAVCAARDDSFAEGSGHIARCDGPVVP